MWVVAAKEIKVSRDGRTVVLKRGDPCPEVEGWKEPDLWERAGYVRRVPDPPPTNDARSPDLVSVSDATAAAKVPPMTKVHRKAKVPRPDCDHIDLFLTARCARDEAARVGSSELLAAYRAWCATCGTTPMSQRGLGLALRRLGLANVKSHGVKVWVGVRLV